MEDENHEFQSRHLFKIGCSIFMDSMDFIFKISRLGFGFQSECLLATSGNHQMLVLLAGNFYCRERPVHRKRYLKQISGVQSTLFKQLRMEVSP